MFEKLFKKGEKMENKLNDLLVLVEEAPVFQAEPYDPLQTMVKIEELKALGFKSLAQTMDQKVTLKAKLAKIAEYKYLVIEEKKIHEFLDKKVAEYNKTHKKPKQQQQVNSIFGSGFANPIFQSHFLNQIVIDDVTIRQRAGYAGSPVIQRECQHISKATNDFHNRENNTIGKYEWTETPIESYGKLPPSEVLSSFEVHKGRKVFDYYTVAEVNEVKDPFLIGRIEGRSERWFIAQWGDDVNLDDVI